MLKPKDAKRQSDKTKEAVQGKTNPQAVGTSVSELKHIRNGGLVMSSGENEIDKIRQEAKGKFRREYNFRKHLTPKWEF